MTHYTTATINFWSIAGQALHKMWSMLAEQPGSNRNFLGIHSITVVAYNLAIVVRLGDSQKRINYHYSSFSNDSQKNSIQS
jgi:hypothetical protein